MLENFEYSATGVGCGKAHKKKGSGPRAPPRRISPGPQGHLRFIKKEARASRRSACMAGCPLATAYCLLLLPIAALRTGLKQEGPGRRTSCSSAARGCLRVGRPSAIIGHTGHRPSGTQVPCRHTHTHTHTASEMNFSNGLVSNRGCCRAPTPQGKDFRRARTASTGTCSSRSFRQLQYPSSAH